MNLDMLRENPYIREKKYDNISSFNFTPKAFFEQHWDDMTIKARGLFIDTSNNKVVARSYDKFFNIEERPETELRNLKNKMKFPVIAYRKENGFLGLISYDKDTDDLLFTTKSSLDNDYVEYFKDIFYSKVDRKGIEKIKSYAKEADVTFVFEVIDIINDPHIIKYDESTIVLLDIIHNVIDTFYPLKYEVMASIAYSIGIKPKAKVITLYNWEDFVAFYRKVLTDYKNKIEGYVFVDDNNYMLKFKTPYYLFWKEMRKIINSNKAIYTEVVKSIANNKRIYNVRLATIFIKWFYENNMRKENIIALRDKFYDDLNKIKEDLSKIKATAAECEEIFSEE